MSEDTEKLALEILNIEEKFISIIENIDRNNINTIYDNIYIYINKYLYLKRKIKIYYIDNVIAFIDHPGARKIIRKLRNNEDLLIDECIRILLKNRESENIDTFLGNYTDAYYDEDIDHIEAMIEGSDCISNLYSISGIVVKTDSIPDNLKLYASQARYCYACNLNIATISLCRSMIEICLNDIYRRYISPNIPREEVYQKSLYDLIENLFENDHIIKKRFHKLRREMNKCIHGDPVKSTIDIDNIYMKTINCINEIYDNY